MSWRSLSLLGSAARTATVATAIQHTPQALALRLWVDVTAYPAAASVTVAIRAYTPYAPRVSSTLLTSAAITGVSQNLYQVGPLTDVTNLIENSFMPQYWDVNLTHADADSITYSVQAEVWNEQ